MTGITRIKEVCIKLSLLNKQYYVTYPSQPPYIPVYTYFLPSSKPDKYVGMNVLSPLVVAYRGEVIFEASNTKTPKILPLKETIIMAKTAKKVAKAAPVKAAKVAKVASKTPATKGRPVTKGPTVGTAIMDLMKKFKGNPDFEVCLAAAKKIMPDTKYDKKQHAFYKHKFKVEND